MIYAIMGLVTVGAIYFIVIQPDDVSEANHNIQSGLAAFVISGWFALALLWAINLAGM